MAEENKNDETNEPHPNYGNKIVFFKSFEEMNEYDYKQYAEMSHEELLKDVNSMMCRLYADKLKDPSTFENKIYFD